MPLLGDLDDPATLGRLGGLADAVLHLAPPAPDRRGRTSAPATCCTRWRASRGHRCIVYGSTSGVYGDAGGARFDETRAVAPATDRARRRVDAEQQLRRFGRGSACASCCCGFPASMRATVPAAIRASAWRAARRCCAPTEDVHTNHIHADDLARACVAALRHGLPQRAVMSVDDSELPMGDYFDLAADLCGLPRPPRVTRGRTAASGCRRWR